MRRLLLFAVLASGQPAEIVYQHIATYGSKEGIHPPRIVNRKSIKAAIGEGEHPYGLGFPSSAVMDPKHRLWIADSGTSSVHIFDPPTGSYREIRRAGDSELRQPSGLATDRQGYIYLTDSALGAVFVFDQEGEFDRPLISKKSGHLLDTPDLIAASEDGRAIYVADAARRHLIAFNREGELITTIGNDETPIDALAIAVIGSEIHVLDRISHKIRVFSAGGVLRREWEWPEVRLPSAFAWDRRRELYFVVNPRWMAIQIFDRDGHNVGSFGNYGDSVQQMKAVQSLYVDADGHVVAVDSHSGKVLVFGPATLKH
jgi:DNA-binding beta-propeller fold protein YncE